MKRRQGSPLALVAMALLVLGLLTSRRDWRAL
jgi:hypothetical protein